MPRNGRSSAALKTYNAKRDFSLTPEPSGTKSAARARGEPQALSFVIQKHAASHLHYDFRLELDGVLLSWAVPKGPSLDPADKRMAVRTEDHPLAYGGFEGEIPAGQYGAGRVIVWDNGTWEPLADPHAGLQAGKLPFVLHGHKLQGAWELVRMRKPEERREAWLLFKKRDAHARPRSEFDVLVAQPDSVLSKARPRARKAAAKRVAGTAGGKRASDPAPARARKTAGDAVSLPPGARRAALPESLAPQLATLAGGVPHDGDWRFEVKFDGYRLLARIDRGRARLITRNGNDWTEKLPAIRAAVEALPLRSAWIDGEIVVMNARGVPDFNALQNAFDRHRTAAVRYFVFDLPYFGGYDLRALPQRERRRLLETLVGTKQRGVLQLSTELDADSASVLDAACRMYLEGVIAKRTDAPYVSRRSDTWLKLKCGRRQEFVIGGFTERGNQPGAAEVGALLLGVHDDAGRLVPVGRVGTGWDLATARELRRKLEALRTTSSPFAVPPAASTRWSKGRAAAGTHWVKPRLVAEVSFGEWTPGAQLRHASFIALRTDKPPRAITREKEVSMPASRKSARGAARAAPAPARRSSAHVPAARSGDVKITNPDRVIDASTGITKLDLVRYYEGVARWMLPHLKDRPCSFVRAPAGIGGEIFFQKHADSGTLPHVTVLDPKLWPEHAALLSVDTQPALIGAAQMNTVEFHTWNAKAPDIDTPDRVVFDLDPGEGVSFAQVREGAELARSLLAELGLKSWLKTSGGKGLHVVVPIAPKLDSSTVKQFSKQVVEHLAQVIPQRFVAKSGPKNRVGRIFADYLRNGLGATTVAAFSARARPGMGVSMTLAWDDLPGVKSGAQWTIRNALDHLSLRGPDPWAGYVRSRQTLDAALKKLAPRRVKK